MKVFRAFRFPSFRNKSAHKPLPGGSKMNNLCLSGRLLLYIVLMASFIDSMRNVQTILKAYLAALSWSLALFARWRATTEHNRRAKANLLIMLMPFRLVQSLVNLSQRQARMLVVSANWLAFRTFAAIVTCYMTCVQFPLRHKSTISAASQMFWAQQKTKRTHKMKFMFFNWFMM